MINGPRDEDISQRLCILANKNTPSPVGELTFSKVSTLFERKGGVWGRMDTCICTAESLCCSSETITTLLTVSTPIIIKNSISPQMHESGVLHPQASWPHFSWGSSVTRPLLAAVCCAPSEPRLLWVTQCPRDSPPLFCLDWCLTPEGGGTDSQPFLPPKLFPVLVLV